MRVLLVCEPGKDGAFDHVARLAGHLHRHHAEVSVDLAFSSRRARPELFELVEAVRARGGEAVDLRVANGPEPGDVRALRAIRDLVRRRRIELVHAHSSKAGGLCRLLRGRNFPPVIYTPHAYYGMAGRSGPASSFFNGIERLLGREGVSVASSFDERTFGVSVLGLPRRRVVLIDNGIDTGRFRPATVEEKAAARAEIGLPREGAVLLSVGRDSYQKNYAPLYRALEPILAEGGAFFVHAGAGAEALGRKLGPAARGNFRGYDHFAGVEKLLAAADAFVLTSRYETLCLSALQALAAGLKLFLSDIPGDACLRRIGFDEIAWIEPGGEIAGMLERELRAWLAHPRRAGPGQADLARRRIDSTIQGEKIWKLYGAVLGGRLR